MILWLCEFVFCVRIALVIFFSCNTHAHCTVIHWLSVPLLLKCINLFTTENEIKRNIVVLLYLFDFYLKIRTAPPASFVYRMLKVLLVCKTAVFGYVCGSVQRWRQQCDRCEWNKQFLFCFFVLFVLFVTFCRFDHNRTTYSTEYCYY